MKLCILENDDLDPAVVPVYQGYGAMTERLLRQAGARDWEISVFHTPSGQYPDSFDDFDAILLTGSKADAFSDEAWVVELRRRITLLLEQGKKLIGICFGHQLIALCLGAAVGRAPQGWGVGRMTYDWHAAELPLAPEDGQLSLLVSHQDQVLELPRGAKLLASNAHCPVAAYAIGEQVFCVQGHPEFVAPYSAFLLDKRRERFGEALYQQAMDSLEHAHDGLRVARMMMAFVEGKRPQD
jgi:GMP synthase-like glutamine amidotransferase